MDTVMLGEILPVNFYPWRGPDGLGSHLDSRPAHYLQGISHVRIV